jgi:shikimate kinase
MTAERIYLVGFMGAGKSSVGRELAARLGYSFADLDTEIERSQKISVQEIFRQFGEAHFRQLEHEFLERLSRRPHVAIALGGGATLDPENQRVVDATGVTVWLQVLFDTAAARVATDGSRPLLQNPVQARNLFESRQPVYRLARVHVTADRGNPLEIAAEISRKLKEL